MSIINSLREAVEDYSPLIASAISVANPAAGAVLGLLGEAFGVPDKASDIMKAVKSDPDALLKLKTVELNHQQMLREIAAENYKTSVEDRKDARGSAIKQTPEYNKFLRRMAFLVTIGFFITLGVLFWPALKLDSTEKQILSMLVGVLVSKWQTIIDFYYGSSQPD